LPFLIFVEKLEAFQIFSITVDQFLLNICRDKSGGKFFSHNFWDKIEENFCVKKLEMQKKKYAKSEKEK
jgi:hypothetical protein